MTIEQERFVVCRRDSQVDLTGFTLLLPSVSIGSVAQLAVDVLLDETNAEKYVGEAPMHVYDLDGRFCAPFVGPSSSTSSVEGVTRTPLQVFAFPMARLAVVQQRSPTLKAQKVPFVRQLSRWIRQTAFAEVILLASLDAGLRTDAQMQHPFWLYDVDKLSSHQQQQQSGTPTTSFARTLSTTLPAFSSSLGEAQQEQQQRVPAMPAAGLTRALLKYAVESQHWPTTTALLAFAAEGDNRADAKAMAAVVLDAFAETRKGKTDYVRPNTLIEPKDWLSLFGPKIEPGMF